MPRRPVRIRAYGESSLTGIVQPEVGVLSQERARFWVEVASAAITLALALLTTVWQDWIELVFRVDPDHHSGSLEWSIVAILAMAGLVLSLLARHEWVVTRSRRWRADAGTATS